MENAGLSAINNRLLSMIDEAPKLTRAQEEALINDTHKLSIRYLKDFCKQMAQQSAASLVQGIQYILYCLLERIQDKQERNHTHFREKIALQLSHFLQFVQRHSKGYFNTDMPMPRYIWLPMHEALYVYYVSGKNSVLRQTEKALEAIILQVYHSTTTAPAPTYRQAAFWQQLTEALRLNSIQPGNDHTKTVYTLLCYNFNHSLFIQYVFSCYTRGAAEAENSTTHWIQAFQHINRIIPESGSGLLRDEKDCKKILLKLITNEMNAGEFSKAAAGMVPKNVPYRYNLSVAQLAVALRMQIECGMVESDNLSVLLRYFSDHPITKRATSISFKNLYNNYHEPERAAVQIMLEYNTRMRSILIALLNR